MQRLALAPETIEEGLNEVFFQGMAAGTTPGMAMLSDVFNEFNSSKNNEDDLSLASVGEFEEKGEVSNIPEDYEAEKYKTTYVHSEFSNSIPVSFAALDDQLYGVIRDRVGRLGRAARHTQMNKGFSVLRNANSASFVGADGVPLISASHPTDSGTQSNVISSDLSLGALETAIQMLTEQTDYRGLLVTQAPSTLVVSSARFALATKLLETEKEPGTANNTINFVSKVFPGIKVVHTPYIGAKFGGDDDNWFLLSNDTKLKRFIRRPLMTWMTDYTLTRNMQSFYNAYYRESVGWSDYIGVIGGGAHMS
jgi:hypothetical protein